MRARPLEVPLARGHGRVAAFALTLLLGLLLLPLACTNKKQEPAEAVDAEAPVPKLDLWKGVPPLTPAPTDYATELVPAHAGPKPPPSVSERVELPFPPPAPPDVKGPAEVEAGPLEVLRYSPEGEQGLVDAVTVAFNQPMVPLASVDDLRREAVPLKLEPQPPGQFRWLGTQMVAFEPEGRAPFSTTYKATVAAGTKSQRGDELSEETSWTFTTPSLALASATPCDDCTHVELDSAIVLRFNQPIRRDALGPAIAVTGKGARVSVSSLAPSAWGTLASAEGELATRTVVLRPSAPLAANTKYTVAIPGGVFGEGPNPSKATSISFTTYPPLRLSGPNCAQYDCQPGHGVSLHATTDVLDATLEGRVTVTPEVPGLQVSGGSEPYLAGEFLGDTRYTVTVDPGVKDSHGQELARRFTTSFKMPPHEPQLSMYVPGKDPAVVEASHGNIIDLRVGGHRNVEVRARSFTLAELATYRSFSYPDDEAYAWPEGMEPPTTELRYDVADSRRKIRRLGVDAGPLLAPGKFLFMAARTEPYTRWGYTYRDHLTQIVFQSDLGVTVALDDDSGVVFVASIEKGAPIEGAEVTIAADHGRSKLWTGKTDALGLAEVSLSSDLTYNGVVTVTHRGDASFAPLERDVAGRWRGYYYGSKRESEPRAFFYTDRTPYKPGDTVHLSGILRNETKGPEGKVELWRHEVTANYTVTGPRGHEIAKGEVKISPLGTFSVDIETDAKGDTGYHYFNLVVPGGLLGSDRHFGHSFPVETYRVPEFEVAVARPESKPLMFGETLAADVKASYLHGAPLIGGQVTYTLRREETGFRPPGSENESYSFGASYGWGPYRAYGRGSFYGGDMLVKQGDGETDARGLLRVEHLLAAVEHPVGYKPPENQDDDAAEDKKGPPSAATYTLEATVTDQNHQAIAGRGSFVVHPAAVYVGVRPERSFYRAGERAKVETIVVDLEGNRVAGSDVHVALIRAETTRKAVEKSGRWQFEYKTEEQEVGACDRTSAAAPAACELDVAKAGSYTLKATTKDEAGRATETTTTLYVHGEDAVIWQDEQRVVDLVPQKRSYAPGETATVLLRSPFQEARGVVILEREGIVKHMPVTVKGGTATVTFPVTEAMIPNLGVSAVVVRGRVDVAGAPPGQDLGRPAHAAGTLDLEVDSARKKIDVSVEPSADQIAPGDKLRVTLKTQASDGEAMPAAVTLYVVDEGVLSLMGYQTPDPLAFFHHAREPFVSLYDLRSYLLPRDETSEADVATVSKNGRVTLQAEAAPMEPLADEERSGGGKRRDLANGDDGVAFNKTASRKSKARKASGSPQPPSPKPSAAAPGADSGMLALDASEAMNNEVKLRTEFATTAYFNAEVRTDASGQATVEIDMPENLTTFRVMAVAVDTDRFDRFGSADASVRVRKPIMLRPSLPRFANFGDKFEGSVMVDNQTDKDQAILVGARGLNVVFTGPVEAQVDVPAGESREVRFPMAADQVGQMRLQFAALANGGRDATELSLPVNYPATRQAFATYGVTDVSVQQTIKPPKDALPGFGGLELSMSSTALNGLEDAARYLVSYRYECTEQAASRLLPIFVLGPILNEFPIADFKDRVRREYLAREGIGIILGRQNGDGGFRYWDSPSRSYAYLSAWATFALLEGKQAGFAVDEDQLARALNYLESYVRYGERDPWGVYYSWTSRAFSLWLLAREGRGAELFDKVWAHRDEVPLYARALLMSAAHRYGKTGERDQIASDFRRRVKENARVVHFIEQVNEADREGLQLLMHSDVQTDAIALMAFLEVAPADPLLPKVMAGIMAERDPREGGRWPTTHANAWALLSASRYFTTVEKEVPDYVARIWIDQTFAGQKEFRGRDMSVTDQHVPMRTLLDAGDQTLTLAKEGKGKLYYRLGLRYAPADFRMKAESQGFELHRSYQALAHGDRDPDPDAVKKLESGDWQIKVGTTVRVNLTVVVRDRATFVVVDDPLPAGLEGQNEAFQTTTRDVRGGVTSVSRDVGDLNGLLSGGYGKRGGGWWYRWWSWDHTSLKDDRMLLFADRLPAGVYTHSYTARATTVGTFQLPPLHAEGMYTPEQFGHTASAMVHVVE
ncbi:MAG: Ig-like domain-containing protein [Nannocystaceae bacterium]